MFLFGALGKWINDFGDPGRRKKLARYKEKSIISSNLFLFDCFSSLSRLPSMSVNTFSWAMKFSAAFDIRLKILNLKRFHRKL